MFTLPTCLDNICTMNSMDESVIICDPSPLETKRIIKCKTRRYETNEGKFDPINNLNNNLPSVGLRQPLRTVYESPLNCSKQQICNGNSSLVMNLAAKRFRDYQDTDLHPPVKKQRTLNSNETIIIVSDDESESPIRPSDSEIILLKDSKKSVSHTVPKIIAKNVKNKRRSKRLMQKNNKQNALNTGGNVDDEDIAVVWTSTNGNVMSERVSNMATNPDLPIDDMFFIDITGDKSNYEKQHLVEDCDQYLPPSLTGKNQAAPIKKTKMKKKKKLTGRLREIIVDGCNVAFGFSSQGNFSKMGLKLVLDYFRNRGHTVKIFLPQNQRKKTRRYLETWYRRGDVVFTPSRHIGGKTIVPYDDRFIVEYATKCKGIIVTSDQYRDLWKEKPEWRDTIEKRLIAPTFVGDYVMFPEDPLGRTGPNLDEFLRF